MTYLKRLWESLKNRLIRFRSRNAALAVKTLAAEVTAEKPAGQRMASQASDETNLQTTLDSPLKVDRSEDHYSYADADPDLTVKTRSIPEIDFTGRDNLEAYAEELAVPAETIEKLIGAGIMSPNEITLAERLIRIMREKDRKGGYRTKKHKKPT